MIKNILFDFDGVILDSMATREFGFREIFKDYEPSLIDRLIKYHEKNGGLSRFIKIRYFFEKLLVTEISDDEIIKLADNFSSIMRNELINKKYLIQETVEFISNNYKKINLHIVSGSEQNELRFLCRELGLYDFFITIEGSPTHKNNLVENILNSKGYKNAETILIGDSINDYEAAKVNKIDFYGYNNHELIDKSTHYIKNFKEFEIH